MLKLWIKNSMCKALLWFDLPSVRKKTWCGNPTSYSPFVFHAPATYANAGTDQYYCNNEKSRNNPTDREQTWKELCDSSIVRHQDQMIGICHQFCTPNMILKGKQRKMDVGLGYKIWSRVCSDPSLWKVTKMPEGHMAEWFGDLLQL